MTGGSNAAGRDLRNALIECTDGPLAGQTFTKADWEIRRRAQERMRPTGSLSKGPLDYTVRAGKAKFTGEWTPREMSRPDEEVDELQEAIADATHRWG